MRYIENFKLFENTKNQEEYDDIMGKLLHLYSSIPLTKQKSERVIKLILKYKFFPIGGDENGEIDLRYKKPQDQIRFVDYFQSLIDSKETRGHNFEGFISGIHGGKLSEFSDSKYDVIINNKTWSVKFIDNKNKAPEIGSFFKLMTEELKQKVKLENGITKIFQKDLDFLNPELKLLKEEIWNVIQTDITGGWLIAYPEENQNILNIVINIIDLETMRKLLFSGNTTSPKNGASGLFNLALNSSYTKLTQKYRIKIPKFTTAQLKELYLNETETEWAKDVFSNYGKSIRPDVLRYIKDNRIQIAKNLEKFENFKNL